MSPVPTRTPRIAVLGAGLAGCAAAARLAQLGLACTLFEQAEAAMLGASLNNEGKLHLGYVYSSDPTGCSWHVMAEAAIRFEAHVSDLFAIPRTILTRSPPFHYTVCRDSALPPAMIATHLDKVDAYLTAAGANLDRCRPEPVDTQTMLFNPDRVSAVFATPERAVNASVLAIHVRAAIARSHEIDLQTGCRVRAAHRLANGGFEIEVDQADTTRRQRFDLVINASWDDRLRLDETVGIVAAAPSIMRYKASILFDQVPAEILARLPVTTLVSGPFGDLVKHGDGSVYLSWYPVCKLGQTTQGDPRPLYDLARSTPLRPMISQSIDACAQYIPPAAALHTIADTARVGGGVIVARGRTDITDRSSELHARPDIGVEQHDHWLSIDTGKFTTAPTFGINAADQAARALSG